jgi:hypothetical protein
MQNVLIQVHNDVFNLVDDKGAILFFSEDWHEVEEFAEENDFNIQYEPKDLVFDLDPDCEDGPYVFFDIKYGDGGHDNLGSHNVINLPSFIERVELMECTFAYDESKSKQQVIDGLVAVGATHEEFL